jgi:hypothetical protein
MSCANSKSPANITKSKILNDCYLKCNYNYNYGISSCTATNKNTYLNLSYEHIPNSNQAVFNNNQMIIEDVKIFKPSLHTFDGIKADAELIIAHRGSPNPLLVCIPIISGNTYNDGSDILEYIINECSTKIPNVNESTVVNINNYNLDKIVPKKPFYSYLGNVPYDTLCSQSDYVVFETINGIQLSAQSLNKIGNMISSSGIASVSSTTLFYNSKGPNSNSSNEDIYIDCKPVDENGKILISENKTNSSNSDSMNFSLDIDGIMDSIFFKIFIGLIVALIIYKLGKYLLTMLSSPSEPSLSANDVSSVNSATKGGFIKKMKFKGKK